MQTSSRSVIWCTSDRRLIVPSFLLLFLLLLSTVSAASKAEQRRANADLKKSGQKKSAIVHNDLIHEGSGGDVKHGSVVAADVEWNSGSSPDDEPGDVVEHVPEGSGGHHNHPNTDDEDLTADGGSGDTNLSDDVTSTTLSTTMMTKTTAAPTQPPTTSATSSTVAPRAIVTSVAPPAIVTPTKDIYEIPDKRRHPLDPFLRPGILAAVIGGAVVGLLAAILLVMFIVYRMRKKDEGSYALDEPKQPPHYAYAYQKAPTKEFYA
jgi:hypothetical protein